ncbi:MAG: sulfatase-like hydrolase/transferase [Ignavibacteria bacterium]|jgi:choline-sulfatase
MKKITRRDFSKKVAASVAGLATLNSGALSFVSTTKKSCTEYKRPNFVFITSDQHNAKYLGLMGHPFIRTPYLDEIANNGIVFTSNYCGNPVCVPSRSSMMTGMYSSDLNSFCNSTVYDGSYPTWAKRLRDAGYYCWATGKQDLNPAIDMGFVEEEVDHGHSRNPDITSLFRRPCIYRAGERRNINGRSRIERSDDIEDMKRGVNFIKNQSVKLNKPWVCYVGSYMPHPAFVGLKENFDYYLSRIEPVDVTVKELEELPLPYQALRNFKGISTPIPKDRRKRAMAAYFAMITELDEYIGNLYKAVEETGQLDNTYFIYTSDHGESLGEHGLWLKNNLYDVASRAPLVISGPGLGKGKYFNQPTGHIDLVATMLELAGLGNIQELRGTSLMPLINGHANKSPEFVYTESHSEGNPTGSCMIRKGDWKLIHFSYYGDILFNIKEDPDEKNNLMDEPKYRDKADELRKLLYSKINPEEITDRAFHVQSKILKNFVEKMDENELFKLFRGRLGDGQARVIAKKLKNENYQ